MSDLSKLARIAGTLFSISAAEKKSMPTGKISPFRGITLFLKG
jgi:hypothetical protein